MPLEPHPTDPDKMVYRARHYPEATMSEYIAGFDAGYAYVLQEIERNRHLTADELLKRLKGDVEEQIQNL